MAQNCNNEFSEGRPLHNNLPNSYSVSVAVSLGRTIAQLNIIERLRKGKQIKMLSGKTNFLLEFSDYPGLQIP
jgi:hypothetical protein